MALYHFFLIIIQRMKPQHIYENMRMHVGFSRHVFNFAIFREIEKLQEELVDSEALLDGKRKVSQIPVSPRKRCIVIVVLSFRIN